MSYQSPPTVPAPGDVAHGRLEPGHVRELVGQQAPLHHQRRVPVGLGQRRLGCERDPIGHHLEQVGILIVEAGVASRCPHAAPPAAGRRRAGARRAGERMPLLRSSGLTTSALSMSSIACACRVAAIRPAKPRPRGTRTPWYTSSSIPRAAVATSCPVGSSRRRTAAVSTIRISRTRSSSSTRSSSKVSRARPASVTASMSRNRSVIARVRPSGSADMPGERYASPFIVVWRSLVLPHPRDVPVPAPRLSPPDARDSFRAPGVALPVAAKITRREPWMH